MRSLTSIFGALLCAAVGWTGEYQGEYLEARNADVWTGPCFANGEIGIVGNKAILAWKVTASGTANVNLDGLCVAAVVIGDRTFGIGDAVQSKAVLLVDEKASAEQVTALTQLAKDLAGDRLQQIVATRSEPIALRTEICDGRGCAQFAATSATIKTRCMTAHDTICGHEELYFPPLATITEARPAFIVESGYVGAGLGQTFRDGNSRGAIAGTFTTKAAKGVAAAN